MYISASTRFALPGKIFIPVTPAFKHITCEGRTLIPSSSLTPQIFIPGSDLSGGPALFYPRKDEVHCFRTPGFIWASKTLDPRRPKSRIYPVCLALPTTTPLFLQSSLHKCGLRVTLSQPSQNRVKTHRGKKLRVVQSSVGKVDYTVYPAKIQGFFTPEPGVHFV